MGDIVFDAGALIALESKSRTIVALLERAQIDTTIRIPAAVLAQVWRDGRRQTRLATLLRDKRVHVVEFDQSVALAAGVLCGTSGTADVVDASVIVAARRFKAPVVTSDQSDLSALDPGVLLFSVWAHK